jgi:hypothetical protein
MAAGLLARWRPACWPNMRRGPRSCRSTVAGLVGSIGAALLFSPETQPHHEMPSFRPRFGVPAPQRSAFLGLATGGFCVFAVIGLFTSLVPSMLQQRLQITNHAVVVGVILELFVVGALAGQALRRLGNNRALTVSLALILLGLVLLMVGVMRPALGCFVAGTAVEGAAIGLGFSHGLAAVNQLADDAARARIAASYFMVTSIAAAIPTFGMG